MKITAVETVRVEAWSNLVWVRLHTDEGPVGLGETFRNPEATESYVHETCAPYLLGKDPTRINALDHGLRNEVGGRFTGYPTRSVEYRGNSAVDLALWDLFGQALGRPLCDLLGGPCRERMRIYNTCASASYNARSSAARNWEVAGAGGTGDPLDDLHAQIHRPEELAAELLDEGVRAMKIWPFDRFALAEGGRFISGPDLAAGLEPLRRIRAAHGDRMDVMLEFHGLWRLQPALQIAAGLRELGVYWSEDPVPMHLVDDLAWYREQTGLAVAGSENLGTTAWYREALAARAVDYLHFDMAWIGGLSEGRRIAALAAAHDRTIAPHDCTGPVLLAANIHLVMAEPTALVLETVRAYYRGFYTEILDRPLPIRDGYAYPLDGPGLGVSLAPALLERPDTTTRITT